MNVDIAALKRKETIVSDLRGVKASLGAALQASIAKGDAGDAVKIADTVLSNLGAEGKPVSLGDARIVFQYLMALLQHHGQLEKFLRVAFEELQDDHLRVDLTDELLGDLFRGVARYFLG